jgi:acetylornithine/N-succinyldiaminopimelate aminotransferase
MSETKTRSRRQTQSGARLQSGFGLQSSATAVATLLETYARADVRFVQGEGAWLVDADGRRYLDFCAGIAVVGLGHLHPAPLAAARAQLEQLWHVSNLYWTEPMSALAGRLSTRFGGAQAFFCNSGAEAIEAAIKYARKATGRPGVVAVEGSFHGRTLGALAATGQPAKRRAFEPLVPGVRFARLNDVASLHEAATDDTGLILLEPVQGEGGVRPASPAFLTAASELAGELGALLCLDEVQTGVGRTGTFFAWEQLGVRPQLATLAKALANGLPIGALLVANEAAGAFEPGDHASTFGGNPVACAAAVAVCDAVDEDLLADVRANGAGLTAALERLPGVVSVRGRGLLVGAQLDRPAASVVAACLEAGLLVSAAGDRVLRLTPPLTIAADEIATAASILEEVLT